MRLEELRGIEWGAGAHSFSAQERLTIIDKKVPLDPAQHGQMLEIKQALPLLKISHST